MQGENKMPEYISIVLNILVIVAIIICLIVFLRRGRCVNKIKVGVTGMELDIGGMDEQTQGILKTMWGRFDELKETSQTRFDDLKDTLNESKRQYKEISGKNRDDLLAIREEIAEISEKQKGMFVDHLKMMFYSLTLDDEERMAAGLKYIEAGLNHTMKKDCVEFCIAHPPIYRALTLAKPEWKVEEVEKAIA
jgi:hypothetical protein